MRRVGKRMTSRDNEFKFGKLIRFVAGVGMIVLLVQVALDGGPANWHAS